MIDPSTITTPAELRDAIIALAEARGIYGSVSATAQEWSHVHADGTSEMRTDWSGSAFDGAKIVAGAGGLRSTPADVLAGIAAQLDARLARPVATGTDAGAGCEVGS